MAANVGLDELLGGIARGLGSAQRELDQAALQTSDTAIELPAGTLHLRPLWYLFARTTVELELTSFVAAPQRGAPARFECGPIDPLSVALRGHAEASGTRVRIEIAPLGVESVVPNSATDLPPRR
jgi:hypothetical protein